MASLNNLYRPITFDEVIGNENVIKVMKGFLEREANTIPHSFLITGPAGCGKTTIGRLLATALGAFNPDSKYNPDYREYNTSNTRGIDTIREIEQDCKYSPQMGDKIIYLLDEVHELTRNAMDAILKILETPPDHVYFILCTTDPEKLLETVRSRCIKFQVAPLIYDQTYTLLSEIAAAEDRADISTNVISKIATISKGIPREALTLLEKILDIAEEAKQLEILDQTILAESTVIDLCKILLSTYEKEDKWKKAQAILAGLKEKGEEPEKVRVAIRSYLEKVLLNPNTGNHKQIFTMGIAFKESVMYSGWMGVITSTYMSCFI